MTADNQIARKCREHAKKLWGDGTLTLWNWVATATTNQREAADEIDRLEAALAECAALFVIGHFAFDTTKDVLDYERLAREFNRRQKIAAEALKGGKL